MMGFNSIIQGSDMNTDKIYAEKLASEYAPKDTSRILQLKKLDRKAKQAANIFGYTFGVGMSLVLGLGICLSIKVIGPGTTPMMVLGIVIGVIGIIGVSINYPIYCKLLENGKQKYAFEIMELAKQIGDTAE